MKDLKDLKVYLSKIKRKLTNTPNSIQKRRSGVMAIDLYEDVINSSSTEIFNLVEFLRFKSSVMSKKEAKLKIISINFEGDISVLQLDYDGHIIKVVNQSTNNFSNTKSTSIYSGHRIILVTRMERMVYYLRNDEEDAQYTLIAFKNCLNYMYI